MTEFISPKETENFTDSTPIINSICDLDKDDESKCIIRGKYLFDCCINIDQMIQVLEHQIKEFIKLKEEGWEVQGTSYNDYTELINTKINQVTSHHETKNSIKSRSDIDDKEENIYCQPDSSKYILRGKGLYNGCSSIDQMIQALELQIKELKKLDENGWIVQGTSYDDYTEFINIKTSKEEDDEEENIDYDDESKYLTIRGKWLFDGCNNIDEMILSLESQIKELKKLKEDGWILGSRSFDDYSILINIKNT